MKYGSHLGKGNVKELLGNFLVSLFDSGKVKGIIGLRRSSPNSASFVFTTNRVGIKEIDPFLPDYPVQCAEIVKRFTFLTPSEENVLFILRPCELRAVVELFKLNQLKLDNILFLSMDCPGALKYSYISANGLPNGDDFLNSFESLSEKMRRACSMCEDFIPGEGADLRLSAITTEPRLFALSEKGRELLGEVSELDEPDLSYIMEKRKANKAREYEYFDNHIRTAENLFETLSACINCHNCMRVCPICYCQECFFESAAMRYDACKFLGLARRMGSARVPYDTILFHLGRLNHMAISCVSCGACEEACPRNIPLSLIFKRVGEHVQAIFNYKPGRSLKEELPLKTFREDELEYV